LNDTIIFLTDYCKFENPNHVWMLKGISRNKDNDNSGVKFMRRLVLNKPDDIRTCVQEMYLFGNDPLTTYRLYVSLNSRDVVSTAFSFQKKMIDIGYGLAKGRKDALDLSKKLGSLWKTELEQNCNRGTKRFLLDIDNDDGTKAMAILAYLRQYVKTEIFVCRKTVSGYHIVFSACDTRDHVVYCKEIEAEVDLQRDSMVFVEQWIGKNNNE